MTFGKAKKSLSIQDLDIWHKEVEGVVPLDKSKIVHHGLKNHKLHHKQEVISKSKEEYYALPVSTIASTELQLGNKSDIDTKTRKKMDKGIIPIDGVLDLHNQRVEAAFNSLLKFILESYELQKRFVLIITGKGIRSPKSEPVLRNQMHNWLNNALIRNKIIRFSFASKKHGGTGAFYILIKRKMKILNK